MIRMTLKEELVCDYPGCFECTDVAEWHIEGPPTEKHRTLDLCAKHRVGLYPAECIIKNAYINSEEGIRKSDFVKNIKDEIISLDICAKDDYNGEELWVHTYKHCCEVDISKLMNYFLKDYYIINKIKSFIIKEHKHRIECEEPELTKAMEIQNFLECRYAELYGGTKGDDQC